MSIAGSQVIASLGHKGVQPLSLTIQDCCRSRRCGKLCLIPSPPGVNEAARKRVCGLASPVVHDVVVY